MDPRKIFEAVSSRILDRIARKFPVSCASDEFYYFPHIISKNGATEIWDDFSPQSVRELLQEISATLSELHEINYLCHDNHIRTHKDFDIKNNVSQGKNVKNDEKAWNDRAIRAEKNMLMLFLNNLRDQLADLALWKKQPSLYLTLMNAGLSQPLNHKDKDLFQKRIKNLPDFLEQVIQNIEEVPDPWKEISLSMIDNCRDFLKSVSVDKSSGRLSFTALDNLEKKIKQLPSLSRLNIPDDLLKKIYQNHLTTGLEISQISKMIQDEIEEMYQVMLSESEKILEHPVKENIKPAELVNMVYNSILNYSATDKDPVKLFRSEVEEIKSYLLHEGIILESPEYLHPVCVAEMPYYFRAIRSASSYSIYPEYPPVGGTFYVLNTANNQMSSEHCAEYRMLTAHETYPGHHLLDSFRLSLKNLVRRSIEFPLFYEGWACFSEMMLSYSGYFSQPADRFILAKRRYWRAVRGQADIDIQTGKLDFESAAHVLQETGIPYDRAISSAKIYTLNPGYQICYTIGIRRFLDLYKRYGKNNLKNFFKVVLSEGEILFSDLEELMKNTEF